MTHQKFIVETLRQVHIDNQPSYCELGVLSVLASSIEDAEVKAEIFVKAQEQEFQNPQGQSVIWKFVRVVGVNPTISENENDVIELQAHVYKDLATFEEANALKGFAN